MSSSTSSPFLVFPSAAQRLIGKVAIITGGSGGFGKATAKLFIQHGAKVIIADVQDEQGIGLCKEVMASVTNSHEANDSDLENIISYVHCDVTNEDDVKHLIDLTISKHGKLDIMFNNAGILGDLSFPILESTSDNFKKVFETNVYGGFLGAKHAARVMIPRRSGVILFTASVMSTVVSRTSHAYTMSKHAIIGLMKNLCVEMGQYGIRVNAISPSAIATPLLQDSLVGFDTKRIEEVITEANVLKGVAPSPADVAHAALYLASDEAKFVSGANLFVDGGYSITNPSFSMAVQKLSV